MPINYILDEHNNIVLEEDFLKWVKWCSKDFNKTIKKTYFTCKHKSGNLIFTATNEYTNNYVSTIFLGVNQGTNGNPLFFETLIITDESNEFNHFGAKSERYNESLITHDKFCKILGLNIENNQLTDEKHIKGKRYLKFFS